MAWKACPLMLAFTVVLPRLGKVSLTALGSSTKAQDVCPCGSAGRSSAALKRDLVLPCGAFPPDARLAFAAIRILAWLAHGYALALRAPRGSPSTLILISTPALKPSTRVAVGASAGAAGRSPQRVLLEGALNGSCWKEPSAGLAGRSLSGSCWKEPSADVAGKSTTARW